MQNDEIKQTLDDMLRTSRYTWQIDNVEGEQRVIIDTPAHHILVKDIDQLGRMLVRRGYQLEEKREENLLYRVRVGNTAYSFNTDAFLYKTVAQVAEELDEYLIWHKQTGRRHVQCLQCGMPLLFYGKYLYEEGNCLKWYMCQRVGTEDPHEEQLEACPGCGTAFTASFSVENPPPIRWIDDVSEDEEERKWDETFASPEGQRALEKLAEQARREIAVGKFEEGGFGLEEEDENANRD